MTQRILIAAMCLLPALAWSGEDEVATTARVEVTSPDGQVSVATVTSREAVHIERGSSPFKEPGSANTSMISASSTVYPVGYRDICLAPCSFEAPAGSMEILVYRDGMVDVTRQLQLAAGDSLVVDADLVREGPKKAARILWSVGAAAVLTGLSARAVALTPEGERTGSAIVVGGAAAIAVGIPLDLLHRSRLRVRAAD